MIFNLFFLFRLNMGLRTLLPRRRVPQVLGEDSPTTTNAFLVSGYISFSSTNRYSVFTVYWIVGR